MKRPELLAPAGTLKSMRHAFAFGADAVYAGQPKYSLRARNNEFKNDILAEGIAEAHAAGKKFYATVNVFPHNNKVRGFLNDIAPVIAMKPDALIMADPGLIMMVREKWPEQPVHLSVQMNTVNYAAVRFWARTGVERIILSRELSLDEITEIRQQCPDTELEAFIHGALCVAYSGRCLLSGYFTHRDSNQGVCTNACRWQYKPHSEQKPEGGCTVLTMDELTAHQDNPMHEGDRHPLADHVYMLEEKERPGEYMPIFEDEHGTYIMNSKDLRAIEHVQKLVDIGIDSLKIEGRTKSHYYVARTVMAYRHAIDAAMEGKPLDPRLVNSLDSLSNRGYTDGFYQRRRAHEHQNYLSGESRSSVQDFVGEALPERSDSGWISINVKNRFSVGDRLEFILPQNRSFETVLSDMRDSLGQPICVAPGNGHVVKIPYQGPESSIILLSRFI